MATAGAVLAPGSATAAAIRIDDPPADKGLIVFFRQKTLFGAAFNTALSVTYSPIVREGDADLGQLGVGTYFTAIVDPGLHTYYIRGMVERRTMQIQVEAGEIYYVEADIGDAVMTPTEQRQFDEVAPHLLPSKPLAGAPTPPRPAG